MFYEDQTIADISYDFINTNGAERSAKVEMISEEIPEDFYQKR
jgi:phosphoribosylformylglycinamidine synthase